MIEQQSQFHPAEVAIQKHAGVAALVAEVSEGFIQQAMPAQHRYFFSKLSYIILGIVDQQGYPCAVPLFAEQGQTEFIHSPNKMILQIRALPKLIEALDLNFSQGQKNWRIRHRSRDEKTQSSQWFN